MFIVYVICGVCLGRCYTIPCYSTVARHVIMSCLLSVIVSQYVFVQWLYVYYIGKQYVWAAQPAQTCCLICVRFLVVHLSFVTYTYYERIYDTYMIAYCSFILVSIQLS